MRIFMWIVIGVYLLGVVVTFLIHTAGTPATLGLVLLRTVAGPIWLATGWPHGTPEPMD